MSNAAAALTLNPARTARLVLCDATSRVSPLHPNRRPGGAGDKGLPQQRLSNVSAPPTVGEPVRPLDKAGFGGDPA
ncbi:hypothetical protein JCM33774_63190 [Actinophytocola sp. KF-1]